MIRNVNDLDNYVVAAKRKMKEKLYSDPDVIEVIDNPNLNPEEPDSYIGVNILPHIVVPDTITEKGTYVCFDIKRQNINEKNSYMSDIYYLINVYTHQDLIPTKYGVERHDLLASIVTDIFQYSTFMGTKLVLKQDTPTIMDSYYVGRALIFKATTPNELVMAQQRNLYEHEFA